MSLFGLAKSETAEDLKVWAINSADEIKSELKARTAFRNCAREALVSRLEKLAAGNA